ncbi:MAG: cytochrome P450 [Deltaproteobacteria bacterium]|nr:cytochrome P450 [Deltaproteobacteria bacterium]
MTEPLTLDTIDIIGPDTYAENGYPHEAWKLLRNEAPIFYWDRGVRFPFWAVTKHEDIIHISKQPKIYENGPRMAVLVGGDLEQEDEEATEGVADGPPLVRQLLNMDPPEHGQYRKVASGWFTPRSIQRMAPEVEEITRERLDALEATGGSADFVDCVTAPLTLAVLADMLGVPRSDWKLMFQWTNQIAGSADPEYQRPGESQFETVKRARESLFKYFAELGQERMADPRDDIVSVIVKGKVKGEPLPVLEMLSYFLVLVVAGNETTRNAASGGLLALIENPAEFEKLKRDPSLIDPAVEEIVRWTAPVIQFCRTPNRDVELRGQKIRAGENLCLFYASANRDEEVFENPDTFLVDRDPNPHLGFGIGEHFCLGANLARLELRVLFRQLIERFDGFELDGPVDRVRGSFLGGVKRMPIRFKSA